MWTFVALLLLLLLHLSLALLSNGDELLFVQALWRHGDRAPANTYPKDLYQESAWPQGWGQLSAAGMEQCFNLGAQLRAMYSPHFISSIYNSNEVYVRSTDYDRALMSAMSVMAGLFPAGTAGVHYPSASAVPNWPYHWSPIPIHALDFAGNHILNPFANCPRAAQLLANIQRSALYRKIALEKQPLFNFLTVNTGMRVSLGSGIHTLQDALLIEKTNKMKNPDWLNETVSNEISNLTLIFHNFNFGLLPEVMPEMIKFRGGSLLKTIISDMQVKLLCLQNNPNASSACRAHARRKFYGYSAHDTTLTALLTTFDLYHLLEKGLPGYAACILVELWKTKNGPQVKILYRSSFDVPFLPITSLINGCPPNSDYCPFTLFVRRSQKYMPTDIDVECRMMH
uniref:Uncharacterized protein n=1 Tax=Plectus sambesii TaxID=2011161 RepID=A0A914XP43_9BILA